MINEGITIEEIAGDIPPNTSLSNVGKPWADYEDVNYEIEFKEGSTNFYCFLFFSLIFRNKQQL